MKWLAEAPLSAWAEWGGRAVGLSCSTRAHGDIRGLHGSPRHEDKGHQEAWNRPWWRKGRSQALKSNTFSLLSHRYTNAGGVAEAYFHPETPPHVPDLLCLAVFAVEITSPSPTTHRLLEEQPLQEGKKKRSSCLTLPAGEMSGSVWWWVGWKEEAEL